MILVPGLKPEPLILTVLPDLTSFGATSVGLVGLGGCVEPLTKVSGSVAICEASAPAPTLLVCSAHGSLRQSTFEPLPPVKDPATVIAVVGNVPAALVRTCLKLAMSQAPPAGTLVLHRAR